MDSTLGTGYTVRMGLVVEAFVWLLGQDPRVQRAYVEWRDRRGLNGAMDIAAFRAAVLADPAQDLERLTALVRDELQLTDYTAWLPLLLLADFRVSVLGQATNQTLGLRIVPDNTGIAASRGPKGRGSYIARDVNWYYRAKIKVPPDTVYAIAKEDIGATSRAPAHGKVYAAIERVEAILAQFDVVDAPPAI
jgi:hypothetical protein